MSPQSPRRECAGWFGKLPSIGDFVTRNLPRSFVQPWDEWLSAELSHARLTLADTWEDSYERAPPLCFSMGARVIDERAWQGVLVPSFDRVGRRFPLTVALCSGQGNAPARARIWWAALVAIGRRAVEADGGSEVLHETLSGFVNSQAQFMRRDIAAAARADTAAHPSRSEIAVSEGSSGWWSSYPDDRDDPLPSVFIGLPRGASFRGLFATR